MQWQFDANNEMAARKSVETNCSVQCTFDGNLANSTEKEDLQIRKWRGEG